VLDLFNLEHVTRDRYISFVFFWSIGFLT